MRWLLMLLVVLNVFYFIWHQQEAPLRGKEIISLSLYKGSKQDIRLLSEAGAQKLPVEDGGCIYLRVLGSGGEEKEILQKMIDKKLLVEQIGEGALFKVMSAGPLMKGNQDVLNLLNEIKELKVEKNPC